MFTIPQTRPPTFLKGCGSIVADILNCERQPLMPAKAVVRCNRNQVQLGYSDVYEAPKRRLKSDDSGK